MEGFAFRQIQALVAIVMATLRVAVVVVVVEAVVVGLEQRAILIGTLNMKPPQMERAY